MSIARATSRRTAWHFGQDHGVAANRRYYTWAAYPGGARQVVLGLGGPLTVPAARAEQQLNSELGLSARTPATTTAMVAASQSVIVSDVEAEAAFDQQVKALAEESDRAWAEFLAESSLSDKEIDLYRKGKDARTSAKATQAFIGRTYSAAELDLIELIRQVRDSVEVDVIDLADACELNPFGEERAGYGDCPKRLTRNWEVEEIEEDNRDYVPLHLTSR